ncbi:hypothetical protein SGPA1_30404 [Streptomyces misionensis JCM 4497]
MAGEDRYAHTGAGDLETGDLQDLAGLVAQLLLLVGLVQTVVHDRAGQREHVEGDGAPVDVRLGEVDRLAVVGQLVRLRGHLLDLAVQLGHARETRAGHRLVGGDDQGLEAGLLVQRLEDRHRGHRGAVRVGDDALGAVGDRVRVHLGDDQRHLGVAAPGRGVVDHDGALRGDLFGQRLGGRAARREEHDVEAGVVGGRRVLHRHAVQHRAGRAGRGEQPQLRDREVALHEDPAHDRADLTGGSDDSDPHDDSLCPTLPGPGADRGVSMMRPTPAHLSNSLRHVPEEWTCPRGGLTGCPRRTPCCRAPARPGHAHTDV